MNWTKVIIQLQLEAKAMLTHAQNQLKSQGITEEARVNLIASSVALVLASSLKKGLKEDREERHFGEIPL